MEEHETRIEGSLATAVDVYFFRPIARLVASIAIAASVPSAVVTAVAVLIGVAGASLLRYPGARQLVPGAVLLIGYALLDAAGREVARSRGDALLADRALHGIGQVVVGVATAAFLGAHLDGEGGAAAVAWLGIASALAQGAVADGLARRVVARTAPAAPDDLDETEAEIATASAFTATLLRLHAGLLRAQRRATTGALAGAPTLESARAYDDSLGWMPKVAPYLGARTHVVLLAVFTCAGALGAYAWIRLTIGNLVIGALVAELHRRERALLPPPPPREPLFSPEPPPPTAPPPAPERKEAAPISFRPPPPDE
jgi:hypothetical protein